MFDNEYYPNDEAFALARTRLTAQCGRNLARIHRIPAANHPWLRAYPAEAQHMGR